MPIRPSKGNSNSNNRRGGGSGTRSGPASPITPGGGGGGGGPTISDGDQIDPSDDTVGTPFIPGGGGGGTGFAYFATVEWHDYTMDIHSNWSYGLIVGGGGNISNMYIHSKMTQQVTMGMSETIHHSEGKCFDTYAEAVAWTEEDLDWVHTSTGYNTSHRWWVPKTGGTGFGEVGNNNPPPGTFITERDLVGINPGGGSWSERGGETTYKDVPGGKVLGGTAPGESDYPGAGGGNSTWGDQGQGGRVPEQVYGSHPGKDETFYANGWFRLTAAETIKSHIRILNLAVEVCPADYDDEQVECTIPINEVSVTEDPNPMEDSIDPLAYDNCISAAVLGTL
jgi:hypothetical protein